MPVDPDAGMMSPADAYLPLVDDAGMNPPDMDAAAPPSPTPADVGPVNIPDQSGLPPMDGRFEVSRISPASGRSDQNTEVVINGRGFPSPGQLFAELGETRLLELDVLSASTITAIVPAGMNSGAHDLRITLGDGRVAILPSAFTVLGESLALISVTPTTVTRNQPTDLSLRGAGFSNSTRFSVAGLDLQDVSVESPSTARGTLMPSLPVGIYDMVARDGEQIVRLPDALQVTESAADAGVITSRPGADDGCATMNAHPASPWIWGFGLTLWGFMRRRCSR